MLQLSPTFCEKGPRFERKYITKLINVSNKSRNRVALHVARDQPASPAPAARHVRSLIIILFEKRTLFQVKLNYFQIKDDTGTKCHFIVIDEAKFSMRNGLYLNMIHTDSIS